MGPLRDLHPSNRTPFRFCSLERLGILHLELVRFGQERLVSFVLAIIQALGFLKTLMGLTGFFCVAPPSELAVPSCTMRNVLLSSALDQTRRPPLHRQRAWK